MSTSQQTVEDPVQQIVPKEPSRLFPYPEASDHLKGLFVFLEPAREQDRESVRKLAKDDRIWEFTKTLMDNDSYDQQFDQYFNDALALEATGSGQAFIIRAVAGKDIIGMTRLFALDWKDGRLEIGHTWYIPAIWGKDHNKECKLLLLQYIFETLHFNRVEFRIAHQNIRSQRAVAKIGGVKEGELRKFTKRNDGSWRNTVIFSIINDEWPEKKEQLLRLIDWFRQGRPDGA